MARKNQKSEKAATNGKLSVTYVFVNATKRFDKYAPAEGSPVVGALYLPQSENPQESFTIEVPSAA